MDFSPGSTDRLCPRSISFRTRGRHVWSHMPATYQQGAWPGTRMCKTCHPLVPFALRPLSTMAAMDA